MNTGRFVSRLLKQVALQQVSTGEGLGRAWIALAACSKAGGHPAAHRRPACRPIRHSVTLISNGGEVRSRASRRYGLA